MNEKQIVIEIDSVEVKSRGGVSERTGKPWEAHTQTGYLDTGKRYPEEVRVRIEDRARPHKPGRYAVDMAESTYVNKFGELAFSSTLVLVPLPASSKAAA